MNKQFWSKILALAMVFSMVSANGGFTRAVLANNSWVSLTADPSVINSGGSSTLTWDSHYTSHCSATWTTGSGTSGTKIVFPTVTTIYTITCTKNGGGSVTDSATVTVNNPVIQIDTINGQTSPFAFNCQINPLTSPVTITGSGLSSAPPGQISQYHVQVDWGDGTVVNNLGLFNPSSGHGSFTFTFNTSSHSYSAGSYDLKARLYHSNPPGNDNQADAVITIPICVIIVPSCTQDSDCADNLYCNGVETCGSNHKCKAGTAVDCSTSDIIPIDICTNIPDGNSLTRDWRSVFTSQCNENTDSCTTGDSTISHTCDVTNCQAQCDTQHPCADTNCQPQIQPDCHGNNLYTYTNVSNTCQNDCTCTNNSCGEPTI